MSKTLKDISKELNVSVSTISRVANNKGSVKPKTREMIMKALGNCNYIPNQVARSLKGKSTKTIGIVMPDISESLFANIIKGADDVLSKNGYMMILCDTNENPDKEELYLNLLMEKQIDGIILATVNKKHITLNRLFDKGLPIIFIDNLPDLKNSYDSVIIDNSKASYMAVEHLIKLGHKEIGIIAGKPNETTGYERLIGYKNALEKNGIEIKERLIKVGDYENLSGYNNTKALLESNKKMTAIYIVTSKMTYGAIKAINEQGLKIPQDIAIVGFDIDDPSGLMVPRITTIVQPEERIGKIAGELMIKKLNSNEDSFCQKIVLDPSLIIRDSCGFNLHKGS